ncbi:hypothetical protein GGR50DRAFT_75423 [Xylaria sp. CBS 124048]|nr:hypothetical protein GGR50DRAFT_75423 [Xylaria sp. CBS 124048]
MYAVNCQWRPRACTICVVVVVVVVVVVAAVVVAVAAAVCCVVVLSCSVRLCFLVLSYIFGFPRSCSSASAFLSEAAAPHSSVWKHGFGENCLRGHPLMYSIVYYSAS